MMSPPQGCSSCSRSSCRRRCWGSNWLDPRSCSCSPYQGARRQDCIEIEEKKWKNEQNWFWKIRKLKHSVLIMRNWKLGNFRVEKFGIGFETRCTPEQGHLARIVEVHFSHLWNQFEVFVLPHCYDGITFRSKWSRLSKSWWSSPWGERAWCSSWWTSSRGSWCRGSPRRGRSRF